MQTEIGLVVVLVLYTLLTEARLYRMRKDARRATRISIPLPMSPSLRLLPPLRSDAGQRH